MDEMLSKMVPHKTYQVNCTAAVWLGIFLITIISCAPQQTTSPIAVTATPQIAATATVQCEQELILPRIVEIQSARPLPGDEITVIGSGGYVRDTCGGYIEGSRVFKLYLDNEAIGDLSCYVNHCEGKVTLPGTLSTGSHCLFAEARALTPNECQFEFQVTTE